MEILSDLKLLKSKKLKDKKSNFWNTCPRKLDYLPEEHCPAGIPEKSKDKRIIKPPTCAWWVNSPDHNYCFWKYVRDKSSPDGSMKELVQSDLAKLFGWSSAKTQTMMKEAMDELIQAFQDHDLSTELGDVSENYEYSDVDTDDDPPDRFDY